MLVEAHGSSSIYKEPKPSFNMMKEDEKSKGTVTTLKPREDKKCP